MDQDVDLTADDLVDLVDRFKTIYEDETGRAFAQDAREQLRRAVEAVFQSWDTPRAQVYRRAHDIPDDLGTAVNVVQMVFGNKGETLRDRRRVHARPVDRRARRLRRVPRQRPGRGRRRRDPHAGAARADARRSFPRRSTSYVETIQRLEEHYRDMQDTEFTVEEGTLYLLQTRTAKRTAAAALKAAVDMVDEGLISREEAVARIDPAQLDQLLHPMLDPKAPLDVAAKGLNASPGAAVGRDRLRRRHRRRTRGPGRRERDPRPLGDDPGRHQRDDLRAAGSSPPTAG